MASRPFKELFAIPLRNGLTKPKAVRGAGTKMVNMGELFANPRVVNVTMDRVPLNQTERSSSLLAAGDLLFARQSLVLSGAGKCSIFVGDDEDVCFESHVIRCRLNQELADPHFYYYFFSSPAGRTLIESIVEQGAGASGIRGSDLAELSLPWINPTVQRRVASVLSQIDDKIDINRRINQTLEAMAQAIFKSWFVDFDPVKAKIAAKAEDRDPLRAAMTAISGKSDAELDALPPEQYAQLAATASLFPDDMEESELGEIPRGWGYSTVGDSFILTMGQSPPGDTYNESGEGLPFYQGRTDFGFRFPSQRVFCTAPTRFAELGDTLISVRAPVGDVNMALEKCCLGRGVAGVRHPKGYRSIVFYSLRELRSRFDTFDSEGTVFGSINKKDFQALPVIQPPIGVLAAFERIVTPMDQRVIENEKQTRTLATLRDTLLPKLLSGELSVTDTMAEAEA